MRLDEGAEIDSLVLFAAEQRALDGDGTGRAETRQRRDVATKRTLELLERTRSTAMEQTVHRLHGWVRCTVGELRHSGADDVGKFARMRNGDDDARNVDGDIVDGVQRRDRDRCLRTR